MPLRLVLDSWTVTGAVGIVLAPSAAAGGSLARASVVVVNMTARVDFPLGITAAPILFVSAANASLMDSLEIMVRRAHPRKQRLCRR
jgi:hypothetical protein